MRLLRRILALGAIIHAGVQGIEDDLPTPNVTQEDLSVLPADKLEKRGYVHMPETLEEALKVRIVHFCESKEMFKLLFCFSPFSV
jgi:glutamine synthetase